MHTQMKAGSGADNAGSTQQLSVKAINEQLFGSWLCPLRLDQVLGYINLDASCFKLHF